MTWRIVSLKYVAPFMYGDALPSDTDERVGAVQVFGSNGVYSMFSRANTNAPVIVIGRKGSYGKVNWSNEPVFASDTTFFVDVTTTDENLRWLYYVLQSLDLDKGSNEAAVPGLNRETAHSKRIFLPPKSEQKAIADFLDRETAKIDTLIDKKQRLLELLAERRQALVTHTVTKGLNFDAQMKESGIEWLGRIPKEWNVITLKYLADSIQTGPFGSQLHAEEYVDNGIPVINPSHIRDGRIIPDMAVTVDDEIWSRLSRHQLLPGDIVFARRGEMGRCGLVEDHQTGWLCGTGSLRVRLNAELVVPAYVNIVLSLQGVKEYLELYSVGSTLDNLNTTIVGNIPLTVPPLAQQHAIVNHIDQQTTRIEALSNKIQAVIERLQERREALINEAVTGKIRVTE